MEFRRVLFRSSDGGTAVATPPSVRHRRRSRMCQAEKSDIARNILAYLSAHADARDTLEGIVEWWLVEQRIFEQTAAVKDVLDELVAEGQLLESKGANSRRFYHINRRGDEGEPPGA